MIFFFLRHRTQKRNFTRNKKYTRIRKSTSNRKSILDTENLPKKRNLIETGNLHKTRKSTQNQKIYQKQEIYHKWGIFQKTKFSFRYILASIELGIQGPTLKLVQSENFIIDGFFKLNSTLIINYWPHLRADIVYTFKKMVIKN